MKRIAIILLVLTCILLSSCTKASVSDKKINETKIFTDTKPKGADKRPIRIIKADKKLYYDSGQVSSISPRCGTYDGKLSNSCLIYEIPKNDNECNFDGAEGYQNATSITKEVLINGNWVIFKLFDDPELDMSIFKYCFYLKGRLPNAKTNSEIVVLTIDKNYNFEDHIKMFNSYYSNDRKENTATFRHYKNSDEWGISLYAKDVTKNGLIIMCEQFGGSYSGELQTDAPFSLEVLKNGMWQPVDSRKLSIAWNSIAYSIKKNDITEFNINWEWMYGELSPGFYKLKKEFINFIATGDYEKKLYDLCFTIE